jgi:hypothetical protein
MWIAPERHADTDDFVALFSHQVRDHGGIDAAGHCDKDIHDC